MASDKIDEHAKFLLGAAITHTFEKFSKQSKKYSVVHHLTRRLASLASVLVLFGFLVMVGTAKLPGDIQLLEVKGPFVKELFGFDWAFNQYWFDSLLVISILLLFVFNLFFYQIKSDDSLDKSAGKSAGRKKLNMLFLVLMTICFIVSVFIFNWVDIANHALIWGLIIFIASYSSNRKYGYTRGFSRNDYYANKVKILHAEMVLGLDEEANIRLKLHELIEQANAETYRDTVGDYIEYGNSALKWLSARKIK
jgi:hypothetical protein